MLALKSATTGGDEGAMLRLPICAADRVHCVVKSHPCDESGLRRPQPPHRVARHNRWRIAEWIYSPFRVAHAGHWLFLSARVESVGHLPPCAASDVGQLQQFFQCRNDPCLSLPSNQHCTRSMTFTLFAQRRQIESTESSSPHYFISLQWRHPTAVDSLSSLHRCPLARVTCDV